MWKDVFLSITLVLGSSGLLIKWVTELFPWQQWSHSLMITLYTLVLRLIMWEAVPQCPLNPLNGRSFSISIFFFTSTYIFTFIYRFALIATLKLTLINCEKGTKQNGRLWWFQYWILTSQRGVLWSPQELLILFNDSCVIHQRHIMSEDFVMSHETQSWLSTEDYEWRGGSYLDLFQGKIP